MTKRSWSAQLPLLVTALVTIGLGLPALWWPANTLDEMILLVYPSRMLEGDLPYRDFFTAYGPTQWWLLEGLVALTGPNVLGLRVLGLMQHVAVTLALVQLARPAGRGWSVTSGLLGALLLFRLGDAPYAWLTVVALCLWQVVLLRDTTPGVRRALWGGVLAGLAIGVRPDAALLALVPAAVLLRGQAARIRWLKGLAMGLLPLLPTLVLSPALLVDQIFLGRAGQGAGQSRLPLVPAERGDRQLLVVLLLTVALALLVAALRRSRNHTALATMAVLALPQALQRADANHFVYAGLLCLPLLPSLGRELMAALSPEPRLQLAGGLLGLTTALAGSAAVVERVVFTLRHVSDVPARVTVVHDGRTMPETPTRARALEQLLPVLDALTRPGDTLFVFDADLVRPMVTDVGLYHLLPNLRQSAFHLEITPGVTSERGSGLVEDVERAEIIVLVTVPDEVRERLFPYAEDGSTEARDALRRSFCLERIIDYYEVHVRCVPR